MLASQKAAGLVSTRICCKLAPHYARIAVRYSSEQASPRPDVTGDPHDTDWVAQVSQAAKTPKALYTNAKKLGSLRRLQNRPSTEDLYQSAIQSTVEHISQLQKEPRVTARNKPRSSTEGGARKASKKKKGARTSEAALPVKQVKSAAKTSTAKKSKEKSKKTKKKKQSGSKTSVSAVAMEEFWQSGWGEDSEHEQILAHACSDCYRQELAPKGVEVEQEELPPARYDRVGEGWLHPSSEPYELEGACLSPGRCQCTTLWLDIVPVEERAPVPRLAHHLDRALFKYAPMTVSCSCTTCLNVPQPCGYLVARSSFACVEFLALVIDNPQSSRL